MKLKLYTFALMGALVSQQPAMTQTAAATQLATPNSIAAVGNATVATADARCPCAQYEHARGDQPPPASTDHEPRSPAAADTMGRPPEPTNMPLRCCARRRYQCAGGRRASDAANAAVSRLPPEQWPPTNPAPAVDGRVRGRSNAAPAPVSIPLIQFQDVPLTVAIENLARQAGINYLLDPKSATDNPDQNGQVKAEPTLSIRWENVTAEQALLALLNNYDLQLVATQDRYRSNHDERPDRAPGVVHTRRPAQICQRFKHGPSVQAAFTDRRSHVLPDARTSQLIVVATDPEQDAVDTLVRDLDKPTRQVLIETKLVEVASTPSTSKGINWSGTVADQNVSFGNGVASATRRPPLQERL